MLYIVYIPQRLFINVMLQEFHSFFQGGIENIEIAKSYYCQAIKLNSNNLRALWGLYLVSKSYCVLIFQNFQFF